ncbi:hypothetical protein [Symbioplanes lichenis]|uniref:hypothetical protein n=1 Tax=Symbioplanes lichenis TaxID=1629072 RepID=UPI002738A2C4|nr:hypothetical protein [Actinoplanes lichenis]
MISRRTGLAAAAVAGLAATAVVLSTRGPAEVPPALAATLATQVTPIVEQQLSADWSGDRMGCATRVFGLDPAGARTPADVRVAYVWAQCSTIGTGIDSGLALPTAVHLVPAPTVETPEDGSYGADIERIFPSRVRDLAYGDEKPDLTPAVAARVAVLT